jgi:hypothetical protein
MKTDFRPVMQALFAHLKAAAVIDFTADAEASSSILTDVSRADLLFPGLPVFGPGLVEGVVIDLVDVEAGTVTLSEPVASGGASLDFSTGFLSADTRVLHWQQVDAQPALFLRRTGVLDQVDAENFFRSPRWSARPGSIAMQARTPMPSRMTRSPRWNNWCERASPPMAIMVIRASHWAALPTGAGSRENRRLIGRSGPQAIVRIPILVTLP